MTDDRKEQFTPGPWEVAETDDGLRICGDDRTMIVGSVQGRKDNVGGANAALIAATPEMYDWQDDALEVMRCILQDQYTPYSIRKELEPLIERGEAIQKKARGEK